MVEFLNHHQIPLLAETEILVVGAGSAGCIAALAARHSRKFDVILVERYGFPGGTSLKCWIRFTDFLPLVKPKKNCGSLPDTIVHELNKTGDIFLRRMRMEQERE